MAKKKDDLPKDDFIYQRDSGKSFETLKHEAIEEEETEKKEQEPVIEEPAKEEIVTPKAEEVVEEKVDIAKVASEAAEKATEQLKKEIDEIKGQNLSKKEEEAAIEEAKYAWTKEGRNPKDYDEIAQEAEERAVKRMTKFIEEREKTKADEEAKRTQDEKDQAAATEIQEKTVLEQTQNNLAREIKELEDGGYIPKVVNQNDPDDEGNVTRKALFQKGIEINNERIAKGEQPENSIAKVFFMHFKGVNSQPAGADAPVSGGRPAAVQKENEDDWVYSRDSGKGIAQILQEEKMKARR